MKKYFPYVMATILILAIIAGIVACVCFVNFLEPGVHSFAGYTRLDFKEKVYFVNADTKETSGSSTVTISGLVQPEQQGSARSFRGSMSVALYPMTLENGYDIFYASASKGKISVSCLHTDQSNVTYWLQMSKKNPDIYAIHIFFEDGTSITAYPGENEQEAIANCEAFWEWFRLQN